MATPFNPQDPYGNLATYNDFLAWIESNYPTMDLTGMDRYNYPSAPLFQKYRSAKKEEERQASLPKANSWLAQPSVAPPTQPATITPTPQQTEATNQPQSRSQPITTSSGGYDWEWTPDTNGGGAWNLIGKTTVQDNQQWNPSDLAQADYYRAQTEALRNQKSDWLSPQQQAEEKNRWFIDQQRALPGAFEAQRSQYLQSMNQPKDWISRWFAERQPNPYQAAEANAEISQLKYKTIPELQSQSTNIGDPMGGAGWQSGTPTLVGDPTGGNGVQGTPDRWLSPDLMTVEDAKAKLIAAEQSMANLEAQVMRMQNSTPQAPPTPSWMTQFIEQNVRGGQPLPTNVKMLTPSGQSMSQLNPSQWGMLSGLADYAGQDINDLMWQSEQMNPTGTVRKSGWRPAMQRV